MLDVNLLFKIGAFAVFVMILDKILRAAGKDDIATITYLSGIVIMVIMVITLITQLFSSVRTMFTF